MAHAILLPLLLLAGVATAQPTATQPTTKPAALKATIRTDRADATYNSGHPIEFTVRVEDLAEARYTLKKNGDETLAEGALTFVDGVATVKTTTDAPGWLLLTVAVPRPGDEKPTSVRGGAVVDWQKIGLATPKPDDFDAFWAKQIAESDKIPLNAKLTEKDSGDPSVAYYTFEFDNIDGRKVRGQYARPKREGKFPATIIVPWAGVYGFPKSNVVNPAKQGWIAINVMAHDLPSDENDQFYKDQNAGPLKGYTAIGNASRDTSYFRPMIVGCHRAATWLGERPEWDGKTYLVQGTSQGGLLSLAVAGLYPKATAMSINVPAGCDTQASSFGRMQGWPFWSKQPAILETSAYFDGCNFATRVAVPSLVSVGLIDTICPPPGVIGAYNQIRSDQKELLILPLSDHGGSGGTQKPYYDRHAAWMQSLLKTGAPPAK